MWFFVFILGVVAGLMDDDWPPAEAALLLAFVAFSLIRQYSACRISAATGLGILAYLYANVYLAFLFDHSLPENLSGQTLQISGEVVDVLKQSDEYQQIRFRVDSCLITEPSQLSLKLQGQQTCGFSGNIILNRYLKAASHNPSAAGTSAVDGVTPPGLAQMGERWQLWVRLYPVRGFVNPGQSRYRLLQLANGISARGYVRDEANSVRLEQASQWDQRRSGWLSGFTAKADSLGLSLVSTLLTGKSSALSAEQWQLLQQTGTVHLVVVSGLHLGVLLGAGWFLCSLLPRMIPLDRRWHRLGLMVFPMLLLLPMLAIWPSGVAISRALLMVLIVIFLRAKGILLSPFRILLLVVAILLVSQPLYLLRPGFYYSVWAVMLLLMLVSGGRHRGLFFRIQLVLMAGLLPLQHFWLNTPDLTSGLVNLIAIPLVSLLILPVSLIMVLSPFAWLDSWLANLLALFEPVFWQVLDFGIGLDWGVPHFSFWLYGLLFLFALVWALPAMPGKAVVSLALVVAFTAPLSGRSTAPESRFSVEVFDVGQGLVVAITIDDQLLVYDSGPVFRSGFAPVAMILPSRLRSEDGRIDLLVISHDDKDHAGGLNELRPFSKRVLAGQPDRILVDQQSVISCFQGQEWRWGEVSIEVLYPPKSLQSVKSISDNDLSCVLKIQSRRNPVQSILLTGDIDSEAEQWLLSSGQDVSARWLIASHHGSAGGNSLAFLSAVSPEGVIYSAGYRHSYGHPASKVQKRLAYLRSVSADSKRNINSRPFPLFYREYNTADLGAITLRDSGGDGYWSVRSQRERMPTRWRWRKLN